jgi:carbonic anhydrase/acetyltransferase-like protein (isoleucine patch superfamily)
MTPRIAPTAWVNEAAYVVGDVQLADGARVYAGAVLRGDSGPVVIGRNSMVQEGSVVRGFQGQGVRIGAGVNIGHGVVVQCRSVGDRALLANNATILGGVDVAGFSVVGANSVVPQGMAIPYGVLVLGAPAKVVRSIEGDERWRQELGWSEVGPWPEAGPAT